MKKIVSLAMVAGLAVAGMGGGGGENPYDFRKRLDVVHESGRRDPAAKPAADEFAITDGAVLSVPKDADACLRASYGDWHVIPPPDERPSHARIVDPFRAAM